MTARHERHIRDPVQYFEGSKECWVADFPVPSHWQLICWPLGVVVRWQDFTEAKHAPIKVLTGQIPRLQETIGLQALPEEPVPHSQSTTGKDGVWALAGAKVPDPKKRQNTR
jgi:hypothetical protein